MRRMQRPVMIGLTTMQHDMDRLFDNALTGTRTPRRHSGAIWSPMADVCETAGYVVVTFELPGVDRESIELTIAGDQLSVRGTRRRRQLNCEHSCQRLEIEYGPFERVVRIGAAVEMAESRAIYEDGLLEVTLQKVKDSRHETIQVRIE